MSEKRLGGLIMVGLTGFVGFGITLVSLPFLFPAFRRVCLPFLPATKRQLDLVFTHLNGRKGKLVDLGSGDGRIVIEAAKRGLLAEGIELNPWLVLYSRAKALTNGVSGNTRFKCQDLWKVNLSPYNNIVIFGVDSMMAQLEEKLAMELVDGSWVIACRFPLPSWKPITITEAGVDSVWVYERGISDARSTNSQRNIDNKS
ncbi:protein FAM173B-like [Centruroides sculpturatus]|uniref:protein FAM173B-like n=1 Tax=Centruroides sculpturatus TaxID=218467 RepID=UPI000C6D1E24|nr:protein FAM173B-like [Centruroides sculpturatus]